MSESTVRTPGGLSAPLGGLSAVQNFEPTDLQTSLTKSGSDRRTGSEYVQCFREVKNRCYSSRITEKEAIDLAVLGIAKPIKDLIFQLDFTSLAHMVQKLTTYEHYHPELY